MAKRAFSARKSPSCAAGAHSRSCAQHSVALAQNIPAGQARRQSSLSMQTSRRSTQGILGGMCARRGARYSCVETSELEKPRYLPRVVDIDGVGGGCLGQARHGHHIAGEYYVKTSTGTRDDFPNMQGVAFRSTELTGIIGEGILR